MPDSGGFFLSDTAIPRCPDAQIFSTVDIVVPDNEPAFLSLSSRLDVKVDNDGLIPTRSRCVGEAVAH